MFYFGRPADVILVIRLIDVIVHIRYNSGKKRRKKCMIKKRNTG